MVKKDIKNSVKETLEVLDDIKKVEVSPFFAHQVLQAIKIEKEHQIEKTDAVFSWFSPNVQLASLAIILIINVTAILYGFKAGEVSSSSSEIEQFAVEYHLQSENNSIIN